jgi:antitoxin component YwqK of YwqJK toxin-antitoxin module
MRILWQICNYVDDKFFGEYKSYYSNGQLKEISNYVNDIKQT